MRPEPDRLLLAASSPPISQWLSVATTMNSAVATNAVSDAPESTADQPAAMQERWCCSMAIGQGSRDRLVGIGNLGDQLLVLVPGIAHCRPHRTQCHEFLWKGLQERRQGLAVLVVSGSGHTA
jgi:hypothetical protein